MPHSRVSFLNGSDDRLGRQVVQDDEMVLAVGQSLELGVEMGVVEANQQPVSTEVQPNDGSEVTLGSCHVGLIAGHGVQAKAALWHSEVG